ncbi:Mitochondrial solute carrier protein [Perkinsela sp. CCAP 1560/4]|nr:Mitochondrial solute carrier protein [Perkinsela sp. CCAP 1560/4]|eukprot:KNH08743.1 Mitochondrial solute carrier protein [Perkinsela sp. CCAP 1560/4]
MGEQYDGSYFLKAAAAGGICCSVTHSMVCPFDVVKTRIQLKPAEYNAGMVSAFRKIVKDEGIKALTLGIGPTAVGYFVQGWFKFGGVEYFKIRAVQKLGDENAWRYRSAIYLGSAAVAEVIADVFLCPLEATRIRLVSNPNYAPGLIAAFPKIIKQEGIFKGFYAGFFPILCKQVPYTMTKFAVQGRAAEAIANGVSLDLSKASEKQKMAIALTSGTIAGVAAAIISHPADTLLSIINKSPTAGGTGSIVSRLLCLARETGLRKLCTTGLAARCVMIGALTAGQFAIFDVTMSMCGAQKFHFRNPNE